MKFSWVLPLAAFSSAFVLPEEQVLRDLAIEKQDRYQDLVGSAQNVKDKAVEFIKNGIEQVTDSFDDLISAAEDEAEHLHSTLEDEYFAVNSWVNSAWEHGFGSNEDHDHPPHHGPPHHGPPHHGPPHHGPPHHGPPHHGPPHHGPPHHGPPHHGPRNQTIYQLISKSKYTTILAKLINNDTDLVKLLNSTKANHTLFAPTDHAFSKIPEGAKKPSKEALKNILLYHVVPDIYPAGRVLYSKTFPTLYKEKSLGNQSQRLSAHIGLKGVTINFYSRIVAVNIPASNGIIHGVDSILLPPPSIYKILSSLPAQFSTLLYAARKTGPPHDPESWNHIGSTVFAPTNHAFEKLGPRINAFLFSDAGEKYLKALLQYHVSANNTLYSTAYYNGSSTDESMFSSIMDKEPHKCHKKGTGASTASPLAHIDLPTLLEGRTLAVDIARYGPFVEVKLNAFARVEVADGVAKDGVIHLPSNVLIPPRQLPGSNKQSSYWKGEEMSVEELKERLEPFVENAEAKNPNFQWEF